MSRIIEDARTAAITRPASAEGMPIDPTMRPSCPWATHHRVVRLPNALAMSRRRAAARRGNRQASLAYGRFDGEIRGHLGIRCYRYAIRSKRQPRRVAARLKTLFQIGREGTVQYAIRKIWVAEASFPTSRGHLPYRREVDLGSLTRSNQGDRIQVIDSRKQIKLQPIQCGLAIT